jgi:hypothetical protein
MKIDAFVGLLLTLTKCMVQKTKCEESISVGNSEKIWKFGMTYTYTEKLFGL